MITRRLGNNSGSINKKMGGFKIEEINHVHDCDNGDKAFRTVVILVLLQVAYVVFDLVEATQRDDTYGIVAGFLMVTFGLAILLVTLHTLRSRRWTMSRNLAFEVCESLVYISLGTAITVVRWKNESIPHEQGFSVHTFDSSAVQNV